MSDKRDERLLDLSRRSDGKTFRTIHNLLISVKVFLPSMRS